MEIDDERERLYALYKDIKLREFPPEAALDLSRYIADFAALEKEYGQVARVRIHHDPPEFDVWRQSLCPVCGKETSESGRRGASLDIRFGNGLTLGCTLWVHEPCLDECVETDEPSGVPW